MPLMLAQQTPTDADGAAEIPVVEPSTPIGGTPIQTEATVEPGSIAWNDLSILDWNGWGLEVKIGLLWILVAILTVVIVRLGWPFVQRKFFRGYRTQTVRLAFAGLEVDICPDNETRRIAYQAWVEIQTRKVGLRFVEDHDVICEVYDSWYQLFGILRNLAKSIPADRLKDCDDTRRVVDVLMTALNKGLRPHLTRWQARFRHWYDLEIAKHKEGDVSPQDVQRRYPKYQELVTDLKSVNEEFVAFASSLLKVAEDQK